MKRMGILDHISGFILIWSYKCEKLKQNTCWIDNKIRNK